MVAKVVLKSVNFFQRSQTAWMSAGIALKIAPFERACNSGSEYISEKFSNSDKKICFSRPQKYFRKKVEMCQKSDNPIVDKFWHIWQDPPTTKPKKSEFGSYLGSEVELEALLLAFWCTIGTYLLAKDERQTPTELGDSALSRFHKFWSPSPSTLYRL